MARDFKGTTQQRDGTEIPPEKIRAQLRRMCASRTFAKAPARGPFLEAAVEMKLAGRLITERSLGKVLVGPGFHPDEDPYIRSTARNTKKTIEEYYSTEGADDLIWIKLPATKPDVKVPDGFSYQPIISFNPKHASSKHYALALHHLASGSHEHAKQATVFCDLALVTRPNDPDIIATKAIAIAQMAPTIYYDPDYAEAFVGMTAQEAKNNAYLLALTLLSEAQDIIKFPDNYRLLITMAAILRFTGSMESADEVDAFITRSFGVKSHPDNADRSPKDRAEYLANLKAKSEEQNTSWLAQSIYAKELMYSKEYVLCERVLRRALDLEPNLANIHEALYVLFHMTGRKNDAAQQLQKLRALISPTDLLRITTEYPL